MKKRTLSRAGTLDLLEKLAGTPGDQSLTLYLTPRLPLAELHTLIQELHAPPSVTEKLAEIATASPNGAAVFQGNQAKYVVLPPFPVAEKILTPSLDVAPLRLMLAHDYHIGMMLIRLGSYAIGVCRGEKLVTSKVGMGLVHGRHRQGGSSSHRFERHRDKQIEQFLIRVCGHAREQLEPYAKALDYMVYGGAWETIQLFIKYCPMMTKLDKPILPPLLDIPDPRQAVLESAVRRVWSSTVYEWSED